MSARVIGTTPDNRNVIEVHDRYTLANADGVIDVVDKHAKLRVPHEPLPGQTHLIIASSDDVIVEGHFADSEEDEVTIAKHSAREIVFSTRRCRWFVVGAAGVV